MAGTLKLDQAQFRELEAFSKFGSDLDKATLAIIDKGIKNVEILKQGQYSPVPVGRQIAIIFCGTNALLANIPVGRVKEFEIEYLDFLDVKHKEVMKSLQQGTITIKEEEILEKVARELAAKYEE